MGNNYDLLQGHKNGLLSPKGYEQAENLARTLQNEKVDVIYSSDLARGFETAQIIAKPHGISVQKTPEARERCFGIFEGTSRYKPMPVQMCFRYCSRPVQSCGANNRLLQPPTASGNN